MSSVAAPFGLNPIGRFDAGSLEVFRQYPIKSGESTAIVKGDIVQLVNASNATTIAKMTGTMDGSATDLCGIFMGCRFTDPNTKQLTFSQHFPASTVASDAMAYVVDDPNVLFTIQADGAFSNARDIYGKNAPVVQGTANTALGISRVSLDASEISTNAGDGIKIIDYLGGDLGDEKGSNFPILVCKFNYHQLSSTSGAA
tara:strand:+ start:587 stop:1186 length:600 start_codon:yes stop_codon:yes gene_type:complete